MKHYKTNNVIGEPSIVIPEKEYIALTHYFGENTINVTHQIKKIGLKYWDEVANFTYQLPYTEEGIK